MKPIDKFLDLLQQSVIVQGTLTLLVVSVKMYLIIAGRPTDPSLDALVGLCVGFYFGGKAQLMIQRNTETKPPS